MAKTKEDFLAALAERNTWDLGDESKQVKITIGTLRRLILASHSEGEKYGREEEVKKQKKFEDLLGGLFKPKDGGGPTDPVVGGKRP